MAQIDVEVLDNVTGKVETLAFERISSGKWKYDKIKELAREVTFKALVEDREQVGSVIVGVPVVGEFRSLTRPIVINLPFLTESKDTSTFALRLQIVNILLVGNLSSETIAGLMKKDSKKVFSMVQDLPDDNINKPILLDACGNYFLECLERGRSKELIDDCVAANRLALQLTPQAVMENVDQMVVTDNTGAKCTDHPKLAMRLHHAGVSLRHRFNCLKDSSDITEAIQLQRKAIQMTPEGHEDMGIYLTGLAASLRWRFEFTGELTDLSETTSFLQQAIQLTPGGNPSIAYYFFDIGEALLDRFTRTRNVASVGIISEVTALLKKALQLVPGGDPFLHRYYFDLAARLGQKFSLTIELVDISDAISLQRQALQLIPKDHPQRPCYLSGLGASLQSCFSQTREIKDISEAISLQKEAIQFTPSTKGRSLPFYLQNLGNSFISRFTRTGEPQDISEGISFLKDAVQLTPKSDSDDLLRDCYSELGTALQYRSSYTGDLADISEAISCKQKVIELTPEDHLNMPSWLSDLAETLQHRFIWTEDLAVLSQAILFHRKLIQLTPESDENMPTRLVNLANALEDRFSHTGELADISEAISLKQKAIQRMPAGDVLAAHFVWSLAFSYSTRFEHTGVVTDIQSAISTYSLTSRSSCLPPAIRLDAGREWVKQCQKHDPSQLLEAHSTVISLISSAAGLEQSIAERHRKLISISSVSADAVAFAISSKEIVLALEWLEQGRCIVWNQLNDLRTPLETLREHDPATADEVMRVSQALEHEGIRGEFLESIAGARLRLMPPLQEDSKKAAHAELARQWDQLRIKVQSSKIYNINDFLKPPSPSDSLKNLPCSGIVVVINVHQDRCDALALRSGIEPLHIPLLELSYVKAETLRDELRTHLQIAGVRMRGSKPEVSRGMRIAGCEDSSLTSILSALWTSVVKPILNGIGYFASIFEPPSDLLRIWWCATGPLAFLPIHAAGTYNKSSPEIGSTLAEFAISSYTPTVRALANILRASPSVEKRKSGLFIVSQPDAPHLPRIPGTTDEAHVVNKKLKSRGIQVFSLDSAAATVDRGVENMKTYSCIHLACHAIQDPETPLKSGFAFYDGRLELLSIIQQRLVGVDLAFLSACQTSAGDEKLAEEAVHLAGGMLAAGYRGAVATMWSIYDKYAPMIAEDFYSNLTQDSDSLSGEHAARALHYATQNLRKSVGDSESALLTWVPYVHFGI